MTRRRRAWSPEDDALLRQCYPDMPTAALAKRMGRSVSAIYGRADHLDVKKSDSYLASPAACRLRRGNHVGAPWRYPKGHVPANKGVRRPGWHRGRMRETQFQKGVRQGVAKTLYRPIGTERINAGGYRDRKVNDALPLQQRWRAVHVLVWEAANGPVPRGHAVVFRNGDKTDIRLENLECLSRADLMQRNTVHNLPKPIAQAVQLIGAVRRQINRRTREEQDRRLA